MDQLIDILKGLLTPAIAVVAVYVAYQQSKTNELKVRLDRYDRRFKIYEEVRLILTLIGRDAKASYEDLAKFNRGTAEAVFLFGEEVPQYLGEVYRRGVRLATLKEQYDAGIRDKPTDFDVLKVSEGMHTELVWLTEQFAPAVRIFKRYLDVND